MRASSSRLCSMKITGLSSRTAARSCAQASPGDAGKATLSPGMWANVAESTWECCAAAPMHPAAVRRTSGMRTVAPDM